MVGGDTDVLEDVGTDEEKGVVGEGIEACGDACACGEGVEGVDEIDGGLSDGCGAERGAEEGDVLAFFGCGLGGVGLDERAGEGDGLEAGFGGDSALSSRSGDGDGS